MSMTLSLTVAGLKGLSKAAGTKRNDPESQEQRALIEWAQMAQVPATIPGVNPGEKVADFLFAIPNGGARSKATAGKLKAEGVKAGVWDLQLALPVGRVPGLWVEMKAGKNTLSPEQREWRDRMQRVGFKCVVCWSWGAAKDAITEYLGAQAPRASLLSALDSVQPDTKATARPKSGSVRSEAYRRLVAARPCINCGIEGYSQHAHENNGKGMGLKVDDRRGMPLCHVGANDCHGRFDRYELFDSRAEHIAAGKRWSKETAQAIYREGNWPDRLEYPHA